MRARGPRADWSAILALAALVWAWPAPGVTAGSRPAPPTDNTVVSHVPVPHQVQSRRGPLAQARSRLIEFETAPFPFDGAVPGREMPFFDVIENGRRGRRTSRGDVLWEDQTYADRRVLLHIPEGFDIRRPSLLIVFFHGHGASLLDDVLARQQVAAQISRSGVNAVLVAPQLAVNAADSSIGKLWSPGAFARFLAEAATHLGRLHGDKKATRSFASMPVVLVGYSGGYLATAWSLHHGGLNKRVRGVALFDALYGEVDKFATWIGSSRQGFFVSAHTPSTAKGNHRLREVLAERRIRYETHLGARLRPGSIVFIEAGEHDAHRSYMTEAWAEQPLMDLLARLPGYRRR